MRQGLQRSLGRPNTDRALGATAHANTAASAEILPGSPAADAEGRCLLPAQMHHLLQHSYHVGQKNRMHQSPPNDSLALKKKQRPSKESLEKYMQREGFVIPFPPHKELEAMRGTR